jgi:hypothetical protein
MTPTQELAAVTQQLDEVESLKVIDSRAGDDKRVHREVARLVDRRLDRPIRVSTAAQLLGVSVPTVRAWIDAGVLEDSGGSPRRVGLRSVAAIRPIVLELKKLGRDRNLLEAVLARIEDEGALRDRRLRRSLDELRRGEVVYLTPPAVRTVKHQLTRTSLTPS